MITIERNELIYIYFMKPSNIFGIIDTTHTYISCELLFDSKDTWIGIEIDLSTLFSIYDLTSIADCNNYDYKCFFEDNVLKTIFDDKKEIKNRINEVCHIDIVDEKIYGIELILKPNLRISSERKLVSE